MRRSCKTMYEALKICAPITLMTFAIFTRPNMVVNPGWLQIADTMLVLISTLRHHIRDVRTISPETGRVDFLLRSLLALVSFVVMFHPDIKVSAAVAIPVAAAIALGIWRHRIIAPPKTRGGNGGYGRLRRGACAAARRGEAGGRVTDTWVSRHPSNGRAARRPAARVCLSGA